MKLKSLLFIFYCYPIFTFSQKREKPITFRSLTIEQGLSQNSVTSIAQDSLGYLWLATQDGLNKYDGKTFKLFNKQFEDVTKSTYSKLGKTYVDRSNNLWIITNSGHLEKFDSSIQKFKSISRVKDVSNIFQDSKGDIYIGTYGKGLYRIESKTKDTTQIFQSKILDEWLYEFIEIDQSLHIVTDKSVYQLSNSDLTRLDISNTSSNFGAIVKSKNETVWLGTFGNGLYVKHKNQNGFVRYENSVNPIPENLNIQDLMVDSKNRLWIATYGSGVYIINVDSKSTQHFIANKKSPFSLHYNDVLCLYEDYTGTIWLGTDGAGLSYFDEHLNKFNLISNDLTPNDVFVDVVRSIAVDTDETLWLGTSGKGLTSINLKSNKFKTFTTKNSGLASDRIMSLLYDENELWIGHQSKGVQIKKADGKFSAFAELSEYTIWKIYKDSKAQIWLCTRDHGLLLFDRTDGVLNQFTKENSILTTNNIRTIEEGTKDTIWIGTEDNGLFSLDGANNSIKKIDAINDKIKSLYYDTEILWVGTNGKGLKAYDILGNTVKIYDVEFGLSNNVIYGIKSDDLGNLWLSSNKGITKFNSREKTRRFVENYTSANGLQAFEFNTGAYFKDKYGVLYFGGLKGVNWFNPNTITSNQAKPKTVISKFEIFRDEFPLVSNSRFKHNQNTMTFTFAGLHFSQPEQNLYRYKLVNHDEDWTFPNYNNVAHYTNLPPDEYTFLVSSSNYDGVWNKEATSFNFEILNPWYLTLIAKIMYCLISVLILLSIYKYLKFRWHVKMQLLFEQTETERLKKLDELKTKLYTNISHEFRTPLTLISGPIDEHLSNAKLSEKDRTQFELIQRNSKRLLSLVNQLLDLSKLESGNLKLKVIKGNLSVLLKQIISVFEFPANEKQVQFTHTIEPMEAVWFDEEVIEKVVTNLLANAIKYTPEKGYINFDAKSTDGQLIITIINNGNNLTNKDLTKLFQRYYQTNKNDKGVGIGLALVKELAILSHGNVMANTMNDDDIQFTVTLPIEPSFYNTTEIVHVNEPIIAKKQHETKISQKRKHENSDKPVVLIVEDDADIRQFVSSILSTNYMILEAKNGKIGLEIALKNIPDLIISDIMMPIKDGIELCNDLKYDERTSHIPIILLTAKVGEENEIKGLKTGADDYMTKPFNSEKLKLRVEKLIEIRENLRSQYGKSFNFEFTGLKITSVEEEFFKRLNDILELHLTNPDFNAQKFGEAMAMSRMQLHRKLGALTGFTTTEFLRTQRLKLAKKLLDTSDLTVSEVAYQVGFNTPSYFIKVFKEIYNCTPNEYISKT